MTKLFQSPGKYVQGAGELGRLGAYAGQYGTKALILLSENGIRRFGDRIARSFDESGCTFQFVPFGGESSMTEIHRLQALLEQEGCDLMIGVGGGKIFDAAKAAASFARVPVFICPTVASSDAPCSALSVIYTDDGQLDHYLYLRSNPDLILMDSEAIAASPLRQTVAGMGDALSTFFEARACARAGLEISSAALALARLCWETLLRDGLAARQALERRECTDAVEHIIEANTLLSGIGFESCGLAAAHALHNGFTPLPGCARKSHGEKVAFCTLVQLTLEQAEEFDAVLRWCMAVGLPVTLEELDLGGVSPEELRRAAEAACREEGMRHMPFSVTPQALCDAIWQTDAHGRSARANA